MCGARLAALKAPLLFNYKNFNMLSKKFEIVSTSRFPHNFRVLVGNRYRFYYVQVEPDLEEFGAWQGEVFVREFLANGNVEVMERVYSERVSRSSKAASWSVAREVLRHYLYDAFSDVDLPF